MLLLKLRKRQEACVLLCNIRNTPLLAKYYFPSLIKFCNLIHVKKLPVNLSQVILSKRQCSVKLIRLFLVNSTMKKYLYIFILTPDPCRGRQRGQCAKHHDPLKYALVKTIFVATPFFWFWYLCYSQGNLFCNSKWKWKNTQQGLFV